MNAPGCAVASNSTSNSPSAVSVPCGDTLTAKALFYNSTNAPSQPCLGIKNAAGAALTPTKASTSDPLASNTAPLMQFQVDPTFYKYKYCSCQAGTSRYMPCPCKSLPARSYTMSFI